MAAAAGGVLVIVGLLVVGLLVVGGCVWGLLGMLMMEDIGVAEFVVHVGLLIGLTIVGPLALGPLGGMGVVIAVPLAIAFPLMRRWRESNALAKMERRRIVEYKGVIETRPEISDPYERLGEIHRQSGHYEAAAEYYRQYMERSGDRSAEFRRRTCLDLAEHGEKRSKICTECKRENPQDARYW